MEFKQWLEMYGRTFSRNASAIAPTEVDWSPRLTFNPIQDIDDAIQYLFKYDRKFKTELSLRPSDPTPARLLCSLQPLTIINGVRHWLTNYESVSSTQGLSPETIERTYNLVLLFIRALHLDRRFAGIAQSLANENYAWKTKKLASAHAA